MVPRQPALSWEMNFVRKKLQDIEILENRLKKGEMPLGRAWKRLNLGTLPQSLAVFDPCRILYLERERGPSF